MHFQCASAEHPKVRYASGSADTRLKLSTCSNALLSDYEIYFKETQQTWIGLFPRAEDGSQHSPEPCTLAGTTARAQHRSPPPLPAAAALLLSATQSLHMPNLPKLGSSDAISCNMARIGTKIQSSTNLEKTCFQYKI